MAFEIEDVDDYGQYGLDAPECTITLETDDETYEISLGDYSTMDSQRYVSIGDGNVYLVKNDPMDSFDVTIDALVKNDEIPNFNQVEKISEIKVSGSTSLDAKYKENDGLSDNEDDIYFVNKDKKEQPLDTNLVKTYLNNVNALNLGTYVTYNATDEELVKYGLDEPQYNLEVKYTPKSEDSSEDSGDSTDSEAGSSEKTFILHVSAKQDDKAYVRIGDSKIIYEITEDEYKNVTDGSYDSLRHKSVVTADFSDVDSVKVTLEDGSYHPVDSSEMAFKVAAALALKKGVPEAKPAILEPVYNVDVIVPEEYMGDVMGDFSGRRGRILGMEHHPSHKNLIVVKAQVPLSEMNGYVTVLRSMTQGKGTFNMSFFNYEEVPKKTMDEIIAAAQAGKEE